VAVYTRILRIVLNNGTHVTLFCIPKVAAKPKTEISNPFHHSMKQSIFTSITQTNNLVSTASNMIFSFYISTRSLIPFLIYTIASTESQGETNLRVNRHRHEQNTPLAYNVTHRKDETASYLATISMNETQYLNVDDFVLSKFGSELERALQQQQQRQKKVSISKKPNIFAASRQCEDAFRSQNDDAKRIKSGSNDIVQLRGVVLSERFEGIKPTDAHGTVITMSDILSGGRASNPLTLVPNLRPDENLYVTKKCQTGASCRIQVQGRAPGGTRGPGDIAILFDENISTVSMVFGSQDVKTVVMKFYKRNGQWIETLVVDISKTNKYSFGRRREKDIAGITLRPLNGDLKWHMFKLKRLCFA